jgi:hypothetical protein
LAVASLSVSSPVEAVLDFYQYDQYVANSLGIGREGSSGEKERRGERGGVEGREGEERRERGELKKTLSHLN